MAIETPTNFSKIYKRDNSVIFQNSMPFAPDISIDGEGYAVEFNQAYIFDYGSDPFAERIEVGGVSQTLPEEGPKMFYLKINVDHKTGKVFFAGITDDESDETNIQNILIDSEIPDEEEFAQEELPAILLLELALFEGPHLVELYIRENIHWNVRGFKQLISKDDTKTASDNDNVGIISVTENTNRPNATLKFKSIAAGPPEKDGKENTIEVTNDGDTIYLYSRDASQIEF